VEAEKIQEYLGMLTDWAVKIVPKIILAVIALYIGLFIVKKLMKVIEKALLTANLEIEIREFLASLLGMILKIIIFFIAASIAGIKMSALIGLLAAAGFAVGMALQGFLGNFAAGLTILFFKPYRVGDWVSINDSFGKVRSIQIFNTSLVTPGDKTLVIPNGQVTDNVITNYSTIGNIRLELTVGMGYEESFPRVKKIIEGALEKSDYILKEPEALIGIESYDSHNIVVAIRPYINPDDFWKATFEVYGKVKEAFHAHGVKAAYSEGVELGPIGM